MPAWASYPTAHRLLADSMAVHDRTPDGDPLDRAHTVVTLAELALDEGDVPAAERYMVELEALEARAELFPDWIVDSDCLRAKTHQAAGRASEAAALYRTVVRNAADIGFRMALVDSLDGLAAIKAPGDAVAAAGLVGMADRLRAEARLRTWAPAEHARTVASLVAVLGAERFADLHAEGHALPLPAIVEAAQAG